MRLSDVCIFEIPVYRCSPEQFSAQIADEKKKWLRYWPSQNKEPNTFEKASEWFDKWHRFKKFGWVGWRYNEVIGWVRLIVFGAQIRGEAFVVVERKTVRMKQKSFVWIGKVFEVQADAKDTNEDILTKVLDALRVASTNEFRGRYLDLEVFLGVATLLPWREFVNF